MIKQISNKKLTNKIRVKVNEIILLFLTFFNKLFSNWFVIIFKIKAIQKPTIKGIINCQRYWIKLKTDDKFKIIAKIIPA